MMNLSRYGSGKATVKPVTVGIVLALSGFLYFVNKFLKMHWKSYLPTLDNIVCVIQQLFYTTPKFYSGRIDSGQIDSTSPKVNSEFYSQADQEELNGVRYRFERLMGVVAFFAQPFISQSTGPLAPLKRCIVDLPKTILREVVLVQFGRRRVEIWVWIPENVSAEGKGPPPPLLFFMHGGGFHLGSPKSEAAVCRKMAVSVNAVVCSIGYSLAPEHPFPKGTADVCETVEYIINNPHLLDDAIKRELQAQLETRPSVTSRTSARGSASSTTATSGEKSVPVFDKTKTLGYGMSSGAFQMAQVMLYLGNVIQHPRLRKSVLGWVAVAPWVAPQCTESRREYAEQAGLGWTSKKDKWAWSRLYGPAYDPNSSLEQLEKKLSKLSDKYPFTPLAATDKQFENMIAPAHVCVFDFDVCRDGGMLLLNRLRLANRCAGFKMYPCSHIPYKHLGEVTQDVVQALKGFLDVEK